MEGRGWTWEFSALFDQFFCKPKLALKKQSNNNNKSGNNNDWGTSLVVWWLRIGLPMQGTRVQSLVQEDPPKLT